MITAIGLWVNISYINLVWSVDWAARSEGFMPKMPFPMQLFSLLLPMVLLAMANLGLGVAYLRLGTRQALRLALPMTLVTAPWAIVFAPYVVGWT